MQHNFVEVNNICMYKNTKKVKDQEYIGRGNEEERIKRGNDKNMLKGKKRN